MKAKKPAAKPAKPAKPRGDFEPDARTPTDRDGNEEHARARASGRPKAKRRDQPGQQSAR
jgi:hypothetical protein